MLSFKTKNEFIPNQTPCVSAATQTSVTFALHAPCCSLTVTTTMYSRDVRQDHLGCNAVYWHSRIPLYWSVLLQPALDMRNESELLND